MKGKLEVKVLTQNKAEQNKRKVGGGKSHVTQHVTCQTRKNEGEVYNGGPERANVTLRGVSTFHINRTCMEL